MTLKRHYGVL